MSEEHLWWQDKIVILAGIYLLVFILSPGISFLWPLTTALFMYIKTMAVPVFIGIVFGGLIEWLVPKEYVSKLLAQKTKRTIPIAVFMGFLMTACSHGILAISMQLYKKGASGPSVVAFLLASPWANLPLTVIMFGFFGLKAFFIIFSAIIIAIITGYIFMFLDSRSLIEHNPNTMEVDASFSIRNDIKERISKIEFTNERIVNGSKIVYEGSISLGQMVMWWIMLGVFICSIFAAYVPAHLMQQFMGPTVLGLFVTLFFATVIEICSEGSAPLAFEIYRQTGAIGNSFTFLMAGVVTDYTEIGLLWSNVGWKTAVLLPIITVPQVILFAYLANIFLK